MNPTTSTKEGNVVVVDRDIEESRDARGNEAEIDASGLEVDITVPVDEKVTVDKYQNTHQEQKGSSYGNEGHIAIAENAKNSSVPNKWCILCAFAVVAVASGVTGALIARNQSPSAIVVLGAPQGTLRPVTTGPTTAVPTNSSPTERPSPAPTDAPPPIPSSLSPRQSIIVDAFAGFGPVHDDAFEWLLSTDEWSPPVMVTDTKQLWYERYAVATFLYSTNVPYLANGAFNIQYSVCQWAGVECSNGLEVDALDFCKLSFLLILC